MKSRILKKTFSNYWQEILFIVSIGILQFDIIKFNLTQDSIDRWDVMLLFITLPPFICLIGQFYWNNKTLSAFLSIFLIIGSLIFLLMAVYFIGTTNSELPEAFSMLFFGISLLFTAITMAKKSKNNYRKLSVINS